ncbi:MAG: Rho termination factor N-terminal domain-containing protein [Thermodesulfobacteriota bacterium]
MGEEKKKKEKPLEKMTATELRDVAKAIEGITGAHGMNKAELLEVIRKAKGIEVVGKQKDASYIRDIKGKIRELKKKREEVVSAGDAAKVTRLRLRINRLKKKTRRAA